MLRKSEKNEKKRAIALAAIPLLAQSGLAKTSVESIALAANVAKGTVYLYFKTKEEIILEIWNYVMELLDENRSKRFKTCSSAAQKLVVYFDFSILEKYHSMDILLKLFAMNMSIILNFSHHGLIQNFKDERKNELYEIEKILREGVYSKEFKDINVELIAELFADSFKGTIINAIAIGKNIDEIRAELHPQRDYLISSIKS
ncbi:TetR/AcrR family transcriptional regulator [Sulfurospirillum arcachonense]|uniref:TetR/AcrR family transcriptional regulator n=1 Tax=Sulfurospirillum arcachonense TaxID=57666 RepID=UPI000469BB54|nr:TetR/AcrR family transcriptional regulator [Sulfurospirillum arcachonense]